MFYINVLSKESRAVAPCSLPPGLFGGTGFQKVETVFNYKILIEK
jgi:hypothetical protein